MKSFPAEGLNVFCCFGVGEIKIQQGHEINIRGDSGSMNLLDFYTNISKDSGPSTVGGLVD